MSNAITRKTDAGKKEEHWVEIKLFGKWQKALVSRIKDNGKYICYTGFGVIAMNPHNVREEKED